MVDTVALRNRLVEPAILRGVLSELMRRHQVPGAQLAVRHDGRTVAVHVGEREVGDAAPVDRNTAFPSGSVTKAFTATLAMILVADGDLDLDEPVGEQLSELDPALGDGTLRQLLSHTSGLAADPDPVDTAATLRRHLMEHSGPRHALLPPGRHFSYSNLGYLVVGRLIETVTGMDWSEAMESVLLRPLGIEPVFTDRAGRRAARALATGHAVHPGTGRLRPVRQSITPAEAPTGALGVSAADLIALATTHLRPGLPELLPPAEAARMRQPVPGARPFGLADGWGLGLAAFHTDGTTWYGHDGTADGASCHLRVDPAGDWAVAFTGNAATADQLWTDLLGELALLGVPIGAPPESATARTVPPPAECSGRYRNGDVEYLLATDEGGRLHLHVDDAAPVRITVHADLTFSHRHPYTGDEVIGGRFVRAPENDRIVGLQIGGRFATSQLPAPV